MRNRKLYALPIVLCTISALGQSGGLQLGGDIGCPLKATVIPHVLMYHDMSESENGWRPDYKMAVDIRIQNVSRSKIDTATLALNNYPYGGQWDVPISLEPGQSMMFYPRSVFDLGERPEGLPLALELLKVKYSNGMIRDINQGCDFGRTPIPPPMMVSQSSANPTSASDWTLASGVSPPRQVGSFDVTSGYGKGPLAFSILVTGYGDVRDVKIKQGSWGEEADAQETELVRNSVWFPAVRDDSPVPFNLMIQIVNALPYRSAAQDAQDAQQWFLHNRNACDRGDMNACDTVGILFEEGRGVSRSHKEARRYFKKACKGGIQSACAVSRW